MKLNLHKRFANTVHFTLVKCILSLLLFLTASSLYAQFTVTAVPTDEACDGQGSLALSVTGTTTGTTVNYIVYYLGPTGTSTPVVVHNNTNSNVPGQQDGVYTVEAHQFNGSVELLPFASTQATINDDTVPLLFTLSKKDILCGNDGTITVEVTGGVPVSYKLTSPAGLVVGPQSSNVFTGLADGVTYTIIVTDICGVANSKSITLFEAIPNLTIGGASFPDVELPACDKLTIQNSILSVNGIPITYPLQAKFTVTHYDGTVTVYNVPVPSGEEYEGRADVVIDYHYNQNCHYNVEFTDTCGTKYLSTEFPINPLLNINGELLIIKCDGRNIKYTPGKYVGPFTIEFVNPPAGFNPADFNAQYPGPYTAADVPIQFGDDDTPLPVGSYIVKMYDACDRTPTEISNEAIVEVIELQAPNAIPRPATCIGNGNVKVDIMGKPIETVHITAGPPEYSTTYDVDVSSYIDDPTDKRDSATIGNLPPGTYTLVVVDTCGRPYPPVTFEIKPYEGDSASSLARPDCEIGYGTIQISGPGFDYIEIITAPAAFSADHPLPYDITAHINPTDDYVYMDHLPPGQYKFKAHNNCDDDIFFPAPTVVTAYAITADSYNLIPHCGSFDLYMNHQSTGTAFASFSLQKWNEALGQWMNPETETPYIEGDPIVNNPTSDPEDRNALKLTNNSTNFNLLYSTGNYRIIKQYQSFGDGADNEKVKLCTQTLYEFEYFNELTITGAVSLDCMGNSGNVQINAFGVPPLTYKIVAHNGEAFTIDNGENNTFSGLTSGVYTVEVSDQCGLTRPLTFNVAEIPSLVHAPKPEDLTGMEVCDEGGDNEETFDISVYTPLVLDGQDPDDVTITYYFSENDAIDGTNPIPDPASVTTGTTTIYARATHELNLDCAAVTWFNITVRPMPALTMKDKWGGCDGEDVSLVADNGYASYLWTFPTGATVQGTNWIIVSDAGTYTLLVKDSFGCETTKTLEVVKSPKPDIETVTIKDWTDHDNVLTVVMEPTTIPGNYEYSLDNIHFQSSPVFYALTPGQYTVYVRDEFGCGDDKFETYILTYPKFFTPNADGTNDYWRIYLASLEPDMLIYIYDRFGKLLFGFDALSKGWDGTFNGARLPATDYWFVVKRQNGQELKGHFSMIR